jgi:hypothetical protein
MPLAKEMGGSYDLPYNNLGYLLTDNAQLK